MRPCERTRILDTEAILARFRASPGATLPAIRLKCKCIGCGHLPKVRTANGPNDRELKSGSWDYLDRRARFVRRVLSQAGIDPGTWGYPPLGLKNKNQT